MSETGCKPMRCLVMMNPAYRVVFFITLSGMIMWDTAQFRIADATMLGWNKWWLAVPSFAFWTLILLSGTLGAFSFWATCCSGATGWQAESFIMLFAGAGGTGRLLWTIFRDDTSSGADTARTAGIWMEASAQTVLLLSFMVLTWISKDKGGLGKGTNGGYNPREEPVNSAF